ncbi:MAG TPA: thiosulfate oxidation carrier complex protein SoxZ [Azospira sp.]|nr:thiosulfate oxidation carrier complex protein SoxZ [Azospira sp.]HNN08972.1 thiosulfate oxidation carrier complex protein SoxZ [Azospira sp.]HNN46230.1 thiosulfate oxidation carrier complex protein SoxZ [Azospira sp.]
MADPIKIRATPQGEFTEIRILLQHPMETGQRKDPATSRTVPAHFIQTFVVSVNGKPLVDGQLNTSVSKNPLFAFKARGLKAGDKLQVSWADSNGEKRSDEAVVSS